MRQRGFFVLRFSLLRRVTVGWLLLFSEKLLAGFSVAFAFSKGEVL
jgi:hypothetical protein